MGYVLEMVRAYALKQIKSWEMLETIVMFGLVAAMINIFRTSVVILYSALLFFIFVAVFIFGLRQTVPYVIMFFSPFHSRVFRMKADIAEKQKMCDAFDQAVAQKKYTEYVDATFTSKYILLHGLQDIELLRLEDIQSVEKKEYPFRVKYKGIFYLYFVDSRGKKHELDIHNGKEYNPVRQVSKILYYLQEKHPQIELKLSELDKERIEEMIKDDAKKELYHMK